jgi:beta-lactamase class D
MKFLSFSLFILTLACSTSKNQSNIDPFKPNNLKGCFLLYNLKTDKFEKALGETCQERLPACSTFKVPLAVMAFDSGVLKDENQILKWDGKKGWIDAWNHDQDAKSWIANSVVWFSQRVTPMIGKKKLQKYLNEFDYGNKNLSPGITQAWLSRPNDPKGALAITAYEQAEFMKKLWRDQLPVNKRSMEITKEITYVETSPNGFQLSGKTGTNFYDDTRKVQLGWFISHVTNGDKEYIAVTNFSDLVPVETKSFGGQRAKEITKAQLKEAGLW